jgi:hypothetical protein
MLLGKLLKTDMSVLLYPFTFVKQKIGRSAKNCDCNPLEGCPEQADVNRFGVNL